MELYIYDDSLTLSGVIDIFDSLRWRRRYFQPGEFELHLKASNENISLFSDGNLVCRRDADEAGIIENISIDTNTLIVKGRFLSSLLDRRIVWTKTTLNTTAELAMRTLVSNMEPIPNLILGTLKNYLKMIDIQVTYKNISNTLTKIAQVSGIGYIIKFDKVNKKMLFECYEGNDRSSNQSVIPRAIFSEEFENITNSKYSLATENLKTVVLVGGEGEGEDRKLITIGNITGLDRREIFVDAKDIQQGTLTELEYEELLIQKGLETLANAVKSEIFESNVDLQSNLIYRTDFDLGDVVTCRKQAWNKAIDVRITEIEEVYENGLETVTPTFGSPLPELKDILKEE